MERHNPDDRRNDLGPATAAARARASEMLWTVLDGTAFTPGAAFFPALVRHLASALGVRYVFVAECSDRTRTRVRTLAFWSGDAVADNIEFDLAGTPCEAVINGSETCHTHDLQTRFPDDPGLADLGAESYLGVPLVGTSGEILGHLAALDVAPMQEDDRSGDALCFCVRQSGLIELRRKYEKPVAPSQAAAQARRLA